MRRSVVTPFFSDQTNTMFDALLMNPGIAVGWTPGKTVIRQAILGGPAIGQHWQLVSVSFQAYLRWVSDPTNLNNTFGKLGKIRCGFTMDQSFLAPETGNQYLPTVQEFTTDTTLMETLWDPGSDPLPPLATSSGGGSAVGPAPTPGNSLAVTAQVSPPNPLDLYSGVNPTVIIWMMPSLLGCNGGAPNGIGLDLGLARFTINYDDGL